MYDLPPPRSFFAASRLPLLFSLNIPPPSYRLLRFYPSASLSYFFANIPPPRCRPGVRNQLRGGCTAQFCPVKLVVTLDMQTEVEFDAKIDDDFTKSTKFVSFLPTFSRFCPTKWPTPIHTPSPMKPGLPRCTAPPWRMMKSPRVVAPVHPHTRISPVRPKISRILIQIWYNCTFGSRINGGGQNKGGSLIAKIY